jgi:hypothetical protein
MGMEGAAGDSMNNWRPEVDVQPQNYSGTEACDD